MPRARSTHRPLRLLARLAAVAALAAPASAQEIVIDFDDVPTLTTITDQYPGVVFSSVDGSVARSLLSEGSASWPNLLCTGPAAGGVDCTQPTILTFTVPVNHLRFTVCGINAPLGLIALANVWRLGDAEPLVLPLQSTGEPRTTVDLGPFSRIVRLELTHVIDPSGLGWDDFAFTPIRSIDFDDQASGTAPQYPCATFSSTPGYEPIVATWDDDGPGAALGFSQPHALLAWKPGVYPYEVGPLTIRFSCPATEPVVGIMSVVDVGAPGGSFRVRGYAGASLLHDQTVVVAASPQHARHQLIVPHAGIDRIELDAYVDVRLVHDDIWFETEEEAAWSTYGTGWPGTAGQVPTLTLAAPPQIGSQPVLEIGNTSGQPTQCFLLAGLAKVSVPTAVGGTLLTSGELLLPLLLLGGDLALTLPTIPPAACGVRIHLQSLQHDAGAANGWAFSPGLELDLGL